MTTLITLVNNVLPEIGFPQLATVVGNSSRTAALALALANREGRSLAKKDWRIMVKRNEITTVSSAGAYGFPSDFDRFIQDTEWNTSNTERLIGPLSDERWQADLSGLVTVTVNDRFQVRADGTENRFHIRPVPTSAETVSFFYRVKGWCKSNGGNRQTEWLADNDILLLDDFVFELGLKWRILYAQRREYAEEKAEYMRELNKALARDGGLKTYRILGPVDADFPYPGRIPETGFGS